MKRLAWILGILLLAMSGTAHADTIYTTYGDQLTGDFLRLRDGQASIKTAFAGTIKVPRDSLLAVITTDPVTVVFDDNQYLTGNIVREDTGTMRVTSDRLRTVSTFSIADVQGIYSGDPGEVLREQLRVKVDGNVNAGLDFTRGNSDQESYFLDGRVQARTPRNRYTAIAEFNREKTDNTETEKNAFGQIKYDHFFSERIYMFNSASFEHDEFQDLNLRTNLSAGLGYQFYETDVLNLSFETGLSYVNEDFDVAPDEDSIGARYGLNYEHGIYEGIRLFHYQDGLLGPDIDFVLRSRQGIRWALGAGFQATTQVNFDWDADPPPGTASTDTRYLLTLGYRF